MGLKAEGYLTFSHLDNVLFRVKKVPILWLEAFQVFEQLMLQISVSAPSLCPSTSWAGVEQEARPRVRHASARFCRIQYAYFLMIEANGVYRLQQALGTYPRTIFVASRRLASQTALTTRPAPCR